MAATASAAQPARYLVLITIVSSLFYITELTSDAQSASVLQGHVPDRSLRRSCSGPRIGDGDPRRKIRALQLNVFAGESCRSARRLRLREGATTPKPICAPPSRLRWAGR